MFQCILNIFRKTYICIKDYPEENICKGDLFKLHKRFYWMSHCFEDVLVSWQSNSFNNWYQLKCKKYYFSEAELFYDAEFDMHFWIKKEN